MTPTTILYSIVSGLPMAVSGPARIDPEDHSGIARWLASLYSGNRYLYALGLVLTLMIAGVVFNKIVDALMFALSAWKTADTTD